MSNGTLFEAGIGVEKNIMYDVVAGRFFSGVGSFCSLIGDEKT